MEDFFGELLKLQCRRTGADGGVVIRLGEEIRYEILAAYGLPAAEWRIANNADEAVEAAAQIGFPVVIKADAASIVHKSDVGGVAVDLPDRATVRSAVDEMTTKFAEQDLHFLVQKYHPGGVEVIVGTQARPGIGSLIMFGIGGIYVEILKDVTFKIAPVTTTEAREMLSEIKATPLLTGVRGGWVRSWGQSRHPSKVLVAGAVE